MKVIYSKLRKSDVQIVVVKTESCSSPNTEFAYQLKNVSRSLFLKQVLNYRTDDYRHDSI